MRRVVESEIVKGESCTLDDLARQGATNSRATRSEGRRLVARNGQARARRITCDAGTLKVRAPRVSDCRVDEVGERCRFTSRILPPYLRRSPKVAEVLPVLYLRGLSTGDFNPALETLLGEGAAGVVGERTSRG